METTHDFARIVLLPRPLSPLAAFTYFMLKNCVLNDEPLIYFHTVRWSVIIDTRDDRSDGYLSSPGIVINLCLTDTKLREILEEIFMNGMCKTDAFQLERMKNFFCHEGNSKVAIARWKAFTGKLSFLSCADDAAARFCEVIEGLLRGRERATSANSVLQYRTESPFESVSIPGYRSVTVPVTKTIPDATHEDDAREIIRHTTKHLHESEILHLCGDQTFIFVGGDPGLGKSTLAAALATEFSNEVDSLRSRGGMWGLLQDFKVGLLSLDGATPVSGAILEGVGQDRTAMSEAKRPWSLDLLDEVLAAQAVMLKTHDLIIADLPGKITNITRWLSAHASFGIILNPAESADWVNSDLRWSDYFKEIGVPVIAKIKSMKTGKSMMSQLYEGRQIRGRLNRPKRLITGADSFIRTCSEFLLFDVIPGYLSKVHAQIEHQAGLAGHL